jgi:hypothetical protein
MPRLFMMIGTMSIIGMTTMITIAAADPTIVSCNFERMPPMILTFRGGMGAKDNTLQVGQTKPVPLSVGSNLMTAEYGAQSSFSRCGCQRTCLSALPGRTRRHFTASASVRFSNENGQQPPCSS